MPITPPRLLDVRSDSSRPLGMSFQQHRVELFLRVVSGFFSIFLLIGGIKYFVMVKTGYAEWAESTRVGALLFAGIFTLVAGMWLFVRGRSRSPSVLSIVDSAGTVVTCAAFAGLMPLMPLGTGEPIIGFALILVLVVRAGIVPSSGRRTFFVGLLASAPLALVLWFRGLGTDPATQPILYFGGLIVALWGTMFSVATMVISRVIYGLRDKLRSLGSYRLVEQLGEGGMGAVWRAEHAMLARSAAIKMVRPGTLGSDSAATFDRFEKEAQATAALTCPNTIHLFDFGRAEDGSFYYVMELLNGLDLETLVRNHGPQPAGRVIHILKQVSRALTEAHGVGLVHRDIKPANIFLCRYGAEVDFVKVLDFGLVKEHDEPIDTGITRDGVAVGTPAYMPPEMILGESEIDGRADIYALGCVAYWLLTGSLVFTSESATAVLVKHVREEPVPPSERSELPIPGALDQLVLDCLQKEPQARPASAAELRQQLNAIDAAWSEEDGEAWWRLHHPH